MASRKIAEKLFPGETNSLTTEQLKKAVEAAKKKGVIGDGPIGVLQGNPFHGSLDYCAAIAGSPPYSGPFQVHGFCETNYEAVEKAFRKTFEDGVQRDAQLCIYKDGKVVVDLWGSNTANSVYSNYNGDTLQLVYSSGKAIAAACMAMAADRGYFHYDDKVCKYWPEFAQKGKEDITIADVLRHDSGLHAFHEVITPEAVATQSDPNGEMSRIIAEQEPWVWLNGPRKGKRPRQYHGVSRGYILSQILMRVDPKKRTIGQWEAEELCPPLHADIFCGPHDPSYLQRDVAKLRRESDAWLFTHQTLRRELEKIIHGNYTKPTSGVDARMETMKKTDPSAYLLKHNPYIDRRGRQPWIPCGMIFQRDSNGLNPEHVEIRQEIPSSSTRATARGLAKVMAMLANGGELNGVRLMSSNGVKIACEKPIKSYPEEFPQNHCQGGWESHQNLPTTYQPKGSFGWGGAGGSNVFFHPGKNIGFAFAMTGYSTASALNGDFRSASLRRALFKETPVLAEASSKM